MHKVLGRLKLATISFTVFTGYGGFGRDSCPLPVSGFAGEPVTESNFHATMCKRTGRLSIEH